MKKQTLDKLAAKLEVVKLRPSSRKAVRGGAIIIVDILEG